jgi:hypothetical protein
MKKFRVIFICFLLGLNCIITVRSRLEANTGLSKQVSFDLDEVVLEFDCWSKMRVFQGYRVLECNIPCCYRNDYDADDFDPNGKCRYGQPDPESMKLPNEMGGIPDCIGGGGPDM